MAAIFSRISTLNQTKIPIIRSLKQSRRGFVAKMNKNIDNLTANRMIKSIYSDQIKNENIEKQNEIITETFNIYHQINEEKNYFILNTLLKICFDLKQFDKVKTLWPDLTKLHLHKHNCKDLKYAFLIKCCINSEHIGISKCIQALTWMKSSNYCFKTQNTLIIKLINKCRDNQSLQTIHSLLNEKFIESTNKSLNEMHIPTTLIKAFGQMNDIKSAWNVFYGVNDAKKDTFFINTMLQTLVKNNYNKEAVGLYKQYSSFMNNISLNLIIKACANSNDIDQSNDIIQSALNSNNKHIQTNLIEFYGNNGDINNALNVYNKIDSKQRDNVSTCAMMKTFLINNQHQALLKLYHGIEHKDDHCHTLAIKCCINFKNIHAASSVLEYIDVNECSVNVKNALIEMYGTFGDVQSAQNIYDLIDTHDLNISTNTLMKAYIDNKLYESALCIYESMNDRQIIQDDISHIAAIQACSHLIEYEKGIQIHSDIAMKSDCIQIKTALIDFYGNCRDIQNAQNIFKSIPNNQQSVISIGSMMDALFKNNYNSQCIQLFKDLSQIYNIRPNLICYSILFKACIDASSYYFGKEQNEKLKNDQNDQWMLSDVSIVCNLINLYGKCGDLDVCQRIFDDSDKQNVLIWNAMINAFGRNGQMKEAKNMFEEMSKKVGVISDSFAVLLNVCSHNGQVEEAKNVYNELINDDDIKYDRFVVTSFVDCLSRNGCLKEAADAIKEYEMYKENKPDHIMWMSLLSGCKKYENKKLGKHAYDEYIAKFGHNKVYRRKLAAASVLFSNT